jgi:hypothetical protein
MTLTRDTTAAAAAVQLRILRAMPSWRKLALAAQMQEQTDTIILQAIQQRYPNATPRELRRRLFDRKLGPARALAVYGPLDAWIEPQHD